MSACRTEVDHETRAKGRKAGVATQGAKHHPGYFGDPAATAAAFDNEGFYRMGGAPFAPACAEVQMRSGNVSVPYRG